MFRRIRGTERRARLGTGPLARTSDRLQHLARILLALVLGSGVAVALAVASAHHSTAQNEAAAQAADRHRVGAEILTVHQVPSDGSGSVSEEFHGTALWTDSSGRNRRGVIAVLPTARSGSTISIWIDEHGNPTTRPMTSGEVAVETVGYALLTYIAIAVAGVGAYCSFLALLDRGRSRRWAAEWDAVEPVWSRAVR